MLVFEGLDSLGLKLKYAVACQCTAVGFCVQCPLKWCCCENCSRREALERIWLDAVAVAVLLLWERGSGESGNDGKGEK